MKASRIQKCPSGSFSATRPRPAGNKPVWDLTTKPTEKVRCGFIGLNRGRGHVNSAANIPFAEVVAVCDIVEQRAKGAAENVKKKTGKEPAMYFGDENAWEKLVARDSKGLYARYQRGEIKEVAGLDLDFPQPENPDLYIDNAGTLTQLLAHAPAIADRFQPRS